jgi:hypothetical protein
MPKLLNQEANYRADFGETYRSSAIFLKPAGIGTTISVMNYWKHKNGLSVTLLFTERRMDGTLVARTPMGWDETNVINFVPTIAEGSIEVEAFGNVNLRIPYAAIMAIYETPASVTMVHAYGRNHSLVELEDDRAILEGREGCWTLDAGEGIANTAYFHNGHAPVEAQRAKLILARADGSEVERNFDLAAMRPFETVAFDMDTLWPGYRDELGGETGWATVHFDNRSAFTRMLVARHDTASGHFQTTHSNFDYSAHQTNLIKATRPALMKLPQVEQVEDQQVVIYPRFTPGTYSVATADVTREFAHASLVDASARAPLAFERADGDLPSRLVTGYRARRSPDALAFECSLGITHEKRPPKRFFWGLVSARLASRIYLARYEELYPAPERGPVELSLALYGPGTLETQAAKRSYAGPGDIPDSFALGDIFPDAEALIGEQFGYLTLFCNWGGLVVFTSLEKGNSLTVEHTF